MKSIRTKLLIVIISILFSFATILMMANAFLLDDYYVYKTKSSFVNVGSEVLQSYNNNRQILLDIIRKINEETGYKVLIVNQKNDILYSSVPEFNADDHLKIGAYQREIIQENQIMLKNGEDYYGIGFDNNKDSSFVILVRKIDKNHFLIISQPLSQIEQNAQIANDFFIAISVIMLAIASVITLLFAKKLVKPILEITKIADSIAKLDFTKVYQGESKDEIGVLGNSINNISQKLYNTINDLKLNNEQLINEMKLQKRFIASVSHEFNTPVGLIRGYTEALEKRMFTSEEERKEIIDIIIKEADRLNHLVNDILLVLRFDSKSFKLSSKPINITQLIEDCVSKIAIKAEKKNIHITSTLDKIIILTIDSVRITQVVDNLLSNALNHVNENGEIGIHSKAADGFIKFYICNTGSSISCEAKKHIFESFYRAENSRNRRMGGYGLGLSIVKGIISAHGGECGVNNKEEGVAFWFTLKNKS